MTRARIIAAGGLGRARAATPTAWRRGASCSRWPGRSAGTPGQRIVSDDFVAQFRQALANVVAVVARRRRRARAPRVADDLRHRQAGLPQRARGDRRGVARARAASTSRRWRWSRSRRCSRTRPGRDPGARGAATAGRGGTMSEPAPDRVPLPLPSPHSLPLRGARSGRHHHARSARPLQRAHVRGLPRARRSVRGDRPPRARPRGCARAGAAGARQGVLQRRRRRGHHRPPVRARHGRACSRSRA